MSEKLNFPLPYDYSKDELNVYTFSTVSGVKYIAYFIEINYFETSKAYSFSFEKEGEGGRKTHDKRVAATIISIIKDFFMKNSDSLIYTCDNTDNRHQARKIVFNRWFKSHSKEEFIIHDKEKDNLLMSIIVENNNPLVKLIIEEFNDFFSLLE
jgi:hypothetical protein